MMLTRLAVLAPLLLASTAACGGEHDHPADASESVNCALETTADEFVIGLQRTGDAGVLAFQLVSLAPAPPARGDNDWVMAITATGGAPITDATIYATPFMPKHQHGTPIDVAITALPIAGQYALSPVNLWMPGLWETTIEVSSPAGTDSVVFRACIPG